MTPSDALPEDAATAVEYAAEGTIGAFELAVISLAALLVTPPLLILLVIVLVPTVVLGLVGSVFALPVIVGRHFHRRRLAGKR